MAYVDGFLLPVPKKKLQAYRDRLSAKVMKHPRMQMDTATLPFDARRMAYGGFKVLVEA